MYHTNFSLHSLRLNDEAFWIAVGLRLGIENCETRDAVVQ